jgi:hypothetical protein
MLSCDLTANGVEVENAQGLVRPQTLVTGDQLIKRWTVELPGDFFEEGCVDHER